MNLRIAMVCLLLGLGLTNGAAQTAQKLCGEVIGTEYSIDYNTNSRSRTVNTRNNAFDGDLSTYFASYDRSYTWVGMDLGTPHLITRVGWAPRDVSIGPERVQLAVFEGANRPDFSDAMPLYMVTEKGTIGELSYADLSGRQAFRYVRYVGPNDKRCNVAEVEFYGYEQDVVTFPPSEGEAVRVDDGMFYRPTNLPLVVIHTENVQEPYDKVHEINAFISILSDEKWLADTATIRLRGNASKDFPKKPYRIKWDEKHRVLDSPAKAKKWTLINNYGDKTLMRNMLAFEMSRRVGLSYTPFCRAVDVMLNGEYKGCYQLCDQVEVHKNRVEIEEMEPTDQSGDALTGGYFVEVDAYASGEPLYFKSNKGNPVTIKSPSSDDIVSAQKSYIIDWFNGMESRLFGTSFTSEGANGCRSRLDLDSFLRHFIVGELSGNTDTYWSMYLYKPRSDDRFYTGPVWDFDLAFDNDQRIYPVNNKRDWIYRSGGSYAGNMRTFVDRIITKDAAALQQLSDVWAEVRNSGQITAEALIDYIDETASLLQQSQHLNFCRWPILSQYVHQNPQAPGSYDAEVDIVRRYISKRVDWIDNKLNYIPTDIDNLVAEDDNSFGHPMRSNDVYTISGQRVSSANRPGIYIKNGKKYISTGTRMP